MPCGIKAHRCRLPSSLDAAAGHSVQQSPPNRWHIGAPICTTSVLLMLVRPMRAAVAPHPFRRNVKASGNFPFRVGRARRRSPGEFQAAAQAPSPQVATDGPVFDSSATRRPGSALFSPLVCFVLFGLPAYTFDITQTQIVDKSFIALFRPCVGQYAPVRAAGRTRSYRVGRNAVSCRLPACHREAAAQRHQDGCAAGAQRK